MGAVDRQRLANSRQACSIQRDFHIVCVIDGLAIDRDCDWMLRRRKQMVQHRRLEQRVTVQQDGLGRLQQVANEKAAADILSHTEERVKTVRITTPAGVRLEPWLYGLSSIRDERIS
jgi:hypothetical protein